MNRLSTGSRVTRHTQGLTKSLDAPHKLVVKELELTDFMYVSGPGIVLKEDQSVMFGQSTLEDYEVYYEVHYTSYTHIQRMGSSTHTRIA